MSVIQKVESGYLQLLRVLFLLFATGAIVVAVILGGRYLAQHDAQPEPVKEEISLNLESYKLQDAAPAAANGTTPVAAKGSPKDPLLEEFYAVIERMGKKVTPDFIVNREPVVNLFRELERDPNLGRPFIKQLTVILDAAHGKKEIVDRLKHDFGPEFVGLVEHFKTEYKHQRADIQAKKEMAEADAQLKQSQAMWSLYAAGVLFLGFVGLILLIVLLKIERNLRGGLPTKVEQAA